MVLLLNSPVMFVPGSVRCSLALCLYNIICFRFQEKEYERRREEKAKKKSLLRSDPVLERAKKCYLPMIAAIVVGTIVLISACIAEEDNLMTR